MDVDEYNRLIRGAPMCGKNWESRFLAAWSMLYPGLIPETQYLFHPHRRWRFDFAWVGSRVLVDIHGGEHAGGKHTRGVGFVNDCEKHNAAVLLGWRVLIFSGSQLRKRLAGCCGDVAHAIKSTTGSRGESESAKDPVFTGGTAFPLSQKRLTRVRKG